MNFFPGRKKARVFHRSSSGGQFGAVITRKVIKKGRNNTKKRLEGLYFNGFSFRIQKSRVGKYMFREFVFESLSHFEYYFAVAPILESKTTTNEFLDFTVYCPRAERYSMGAPF